MDEPGLAVVDASFAAEVGMAGIGVVSRRPDHGLVAQEVLLAETALEGEALACIRAVTWLINHGGPGSVIWTDCRSLVLNVHGGRSHRASAQVKKTIQELEAMLRNHGMSLEDRYREDVKEAHKAARNALDAWKAGRSGEPTWRRNPYLKQMG